MNERLKLIRESKGMNQSDFAKLLGMGQSTLAMMEVGKRDILDRHIKTICSICGINEEWLRTGKGEMLRQDESTIVSQLSHEYGLDDLDRRIIESYLQLDPAKRSIIKDYVRSIFKEQLDMEAADEIDKEVEKYRQELKAEESLKTSSVLPNTDKNAG